jgi:hypothetical protein
MIAKLRQIAGVGNAVAVKHSGCHPQPYAVPAQLPDNPALRKCLHPGRGMRAASISSFRSSHKQPGVPRPQQGHSS